MTMEKDRVTIMDRTDKTHEEQEEACSTNEVRHAGESICDFEAGVN